MGRKPNKQKTTEVVEQLEQSTEQKTTEVVELIGLQTIIGTGKYSLPLGVEKTGVNPKIAEMLIAKGSAKLKE